MNKYKAVSRLLIVIKRVSKKRKIIWSIVMISFIFFIGDYLFKNREYFLREYDYEYLSKTYSQSQYVIGSESKGGIGDDGVYSFAGVYYLQGGDPAQVNFEHPPLGKYLIGVSILIFDNENVINLIYFILLIWVVYLLAQKIFDHNLWSVTAVGLVASDPLLLDQLKRSLLDLPFMLAFHLGIYFFINGFRSIRSMYLSALFWGIATSIKFFPAYILVATLLFGIVLWYEKHLLKHFILSQGIVIVVYLASHGMYFYYNPSLIEFLRFRKWTVVWWSGSPIFFGNILRNLYTSKYLDSVGVVVKNAYWTLLWPVAFFLGLVSYQRKYFTHRNLVHTLYWGLLVLYIIYTSFFTGGLQKFLMPVWPLAIILTLDLVRRYVASSLRRFLQRH